MLEKNYHSTNKWSYVEKQKHVKLSLALNQQSPTNRGGSRNLPQGPDPLLSNPFPSPPFQPLPSFPFPSLSRRSRVSLKPARGSGEAM